MKSYACFTSFIDVLTPAKVSLLSCSPENRRYLHSAVTNALSEIAIKYNGKLVHRFEERFACYFPLTSDPKNEKAFQDAIECSIEQRMRMGPLTLDCMHEIKIRRVFYRICLNYEILHFETNVEEAFERSVQFEHVDKICSMGIAWDMLVGDSLYKMVRIFPELQKKFRFRKIGEYQIDPDNQISYPFYILH